MAPSGGFIGSAWASIRRRGRRGFSASGPGARGTHPVHSAGARVGAGRVVGQKGALVVKARGKGSAGRGRGWETLAFGPGHNAGGSAHAEHSVADKESRWQRCRWGRCCRRESRAVRPLVATRGQTASA